MAHLSNVCNVDCNLRALLLDGTDEPVHRVHDAMVIIPAGRGVYVAPAFIVPEKECSRRLLAYSLHSGALWQTQQPCKSPAQRAAKLYAECGFVSKAFVVAEPACAYSP